MCGQVTHSETPSVGVPTVKHTGAQRPESELVASWQNSFGSIQGQVSDSELGNRGV